MLKAVAMPTLASALKGIRSYELPVSYSRSLTSTVFLLPRIFVRKSDLGVRHSDESRLSAQLARPNVGRFRTSKQQRLPSSDPFKNTKWPFQRNDHFAFSSFARTGTLWLANSSNNVEPYPRHRALRPAALLLRHHRERLDHLEIQRRRYERCPVPDYRT